MTRNLILTLVCLSIAFVAIQIIFMKPGNPRTPFSPILIPSVDKDVPSCLRTLVETASLRTVESQALVKFAWSKLLAPLDPTDFPEFSLRLRAFSTLFTTYEDLLRKENRLFSDELFPYEQFPALAQLEKILFPWIQESSFRSLLHLKASFFGKGIVIPCGHIIFGFCLHTIKILLLLDTKLPIVVAYFGDLDLYPIQRRYLLKELNITSFDVSQFFPNFTLRGWQIKPFALLLAPFQEVILMDGDAIFLQSPDLLFNDIGYLKENMLIFRDRTLFAGFNDHKEWLNENLPFPLRKSLLQSRMYRQLSSHEQESGVVVMNKNKKMMGLLATCKLMGEKERESFYETFWGDKESFWIGMEMADEMYSDMNPYAGVFGWASKGPNGEQQTCGHIAHFDRQGWPLWFNGAIVADKVKGDVIVPFTHYSNANAEWNFTSSCMRVKGTPVNKSLDQLLSYFIRLWLTDEELGDVNGQD